MRRFQGIKQTVQPARDNQVGEFLRNSHPRLGEKRLRADRMALVCVAGLALLAGEAVAGGTAFSFGQNAHGRTGLGISNTSSTTVATPILPGELGGRSITQTAAGNAHSLLLADDGSVFSFGYNGNGQTGLGIVDFSSATVATAIDATNLGGRAITQVAAGGHHSLLLADDGSVFSFGLNSSGQLGLGFVGSGVNLNTPVATAIDTSNLGSRLITQVAAGGRHSLLLADDGSVFAFGDNGNGRTGLGIGSGSTTVAVEIDTSNLGGRAITQVAAGSEHSLLLADDGTVFAFGNNDKYRTGLGTDDGDTLVATVIDTSNIDLTGRPITQVAAGDAHSLLLAEDGTVFSFGWNAGGRTGKGTSAATSTTRASLILPGQLDGRSIMQVAAGGAHSLLLADDGSVFTFGNNASGTTGLGTDSGATTFAMPIATTHLGDSAVTNISAGEQHSLLVAASSVPSVPGDHNGDGTVDAADYVAWRKGFGTIYDESHYTAWRSNFASMTAGLSSVANAPEPTSVALLLIGAVAAVCNRSSKRT